MSYSLTATERVNYKSMSEEQLLARLRQNTLLWQSASEREAHRMCIVEELSLRRRAT